MRAVCLSAQHATAGDLLWQLGDKAPPNDGFTAARIYPTQAAIAAAEAAAAAADSEAGEGGSGDAAGAAGGAAEAAEQLGGLQLAAAGSSADAEGGGAAGAEGSEAAGAAAAAAAGAGSAVDMDSLLEAAVLAGLQALKNADLPIQGGDFYTKFMVPAKPEGKRRPPRGAAAAGRLLQAAPAGTVRASLPPHHCTVQPQVALGRYLVSIRKPSAVLLLDTLHSVFPSPSPGVMSLDIKTSVARDVQSTLMVFNLYFSTDFPSPRRDAGHQGLQVQEAEQAAGQL